MFHISCFINHFAFIYLFSFLCKIEYICYNNVLKTIDNVNINYENMIW